MILVKKVESLNSRLDKDNCRGTEFRVYTKEVKILTGIFVVFIGEFDLRSGSNDMMFQ